MEAYTKAEKFYVPAYILMDKNGKVLSRTNVEKKDDYDLHRPLEEYLKIIKKNNSKATQRSKKCSNSGTGLGIFLEIISIISVTKYVV